MKKLEYALEIDLNKNYPYNMTCCNCIFLYHEGLRADRINPKEPDYVELIDVQQDGFSVMHLLDTCDVMWIEDELLDLCQQDAV